jgi:hypothetical protein
VRERLRGVCREGVLRKERERPLQEKRASERYDSALGGAKEGRGGVIIYCEKVMKTFQKICFLVLGLSVVVAGAWYASGSRTIGEVKLPSIPKQNCLEHNKAKHMPKTQEELASYKKAYFAVGVSGAPRAISRKRWSGRSGLGLCGRRDAKSHLPGCDE